MNVIRDKIYPALLVQRRSGRDVTEGVDLRPGFELAHGANHRGGIKAAGQGGTERHIASQL